ncbi:MAG TPA: hypothetical protein VK778_10065 [Solirubrobacteraceae bacterium]|nr:hypothetical protein [Solirubrobacteraceae bacterium]
MLSGVAVLLASVGASLGVGAALEVGVARAGEPTAHVSRTISLSETAHLHRTSGRGITIDQPLNEMGSASGTIRGAIYIHLKLPAVNRVTAEVNIYPSGGSITGYATARYSVDGGTASFSGTMSIARGTGSYDHASGSGLSFSGTIQRSNDAVSVHLSGRLSV